MQQPVQNGGGQGAVIVKYFGPLLESTVRGHDDRPLLIAQRNDLEEQIGGGLVNGEICIHVIPRFPVENLLYLVQKAAVMLRYLSGYMRTYKVERLATGKTEGLFASSLIDCLFEALMPGSRSLSPLGDRSDGTPFAYIGYHRDSCEFIR